ncbi:MAG TPA: glycosyltransferase [Acidobacteriaceae bacterium]|nr:glycosyltransferase [Acidobacteriaceae bacterium]
MAVELSIVMPCLNEAETLAACIRKAQRYLDRSGISGEIIIGDNGSTDGSQEIAAALGARVVPVPVRGYGAALSGAVAAARGRYCIMGDSDDSYDFENLDAFVEKLREGCALVMGNRFRGGIHRGAMPWKNRYLGNPILTTVGRLFFRAGAGDFHCGIRGFSREAFRQMDLRTTGMEFASEMVIKATLLKLPIAEIPATLSADGRSRRPHLRPWRDGWRHLRFMLLYSPRWLFLYPGVLLILAGLAGCAWLLPGPRVVYGIGFDVHTLLYAFVFVLLGFQFVSFGVFTKIFAISEGLLPADPRLSRVFQYIQLETGLSVGALLVVLGLGGSIFAVSGWARTNFGALDPGHMLRIVMPAVFSLTLGVQIICSSFFLSILGLRRGSQAGIQEIEATGAVRPSESVSVYMETMKILMASHYFPSHQGGIETVADELYREFSAREQKVTWMAGGVTPPPAPAGASSPAPLHVFNFLEKRIGLPFPIPTPGAVRQILREVRRADVLLLHDCLYLHNIVAFLAARLLRTPAIIVQHIAAVPYRNPLLSAANRLATALVTRPMLSKADRVVFISETTRQFFSQVRFRFAPEVIFNGVDAGLYRPAPAVEKASLRRRFDLPDSQPVVLFVGRFVEKKGMAAMRHLAASRPGWIWAFAGWGPLNPSAWGAENVRVFSDLRGSSMADLYRACDSLVLPSWGEGYPLVIQEALACGLPVVCATETLQADPALAGHVHGAPVYPGEDQRTALAFLPILDEALASAAGEPQTAEARRTFAVSRYSWARAADRYLDILSRVGKPANSVSSPAQSAAARNCP